MKKVIYIILTILVIIFISIRVYKSLTYTHINAKFKELRPSHEKLPIYYKGIKIGDAKEKKHTDDYQHTLIKMVLYPKDINLPENVKVLLKSEKRNGFDKDYLEIIYPKEPSRNILKNGAIIEGKSTVDLNNYLNNQNPDDLETIRVNLTESSENLNNALEGLVIVFDSLNDILKENQKNIYTSSDNLATTTRNLKQITTKFDNAIKQKNLNSTMNDINISADNIKATTQTLEKLTENFNNTATNINSGTMPQVQSTLYRTECLIANANEITCGIKKTLKKRFGGLRLLFGKVINNNDVNTNHSECCE